MPPKHLLELTPLARRSGLEAGDHLPAPDHGEVLASMLHGIEEISEVANPPRSRRYPA